MKIDKYDIIMVICTVVMLTTTICLWDKLHGWTRIAWALWGLSILIGITAGHNQDYKESPVHKNESENPSKNPQLNEQNKKE